LKGADDAKNLALMQIVPLERIVQCDPDAVPDFFNEIASQLADVYVLCFVKRYSRAMDLDQNMLDTQLTHPARLFMNGHAIWSKSAPFINRHADGGEHISAN
jgi:hypothetical protein